MYKKIKVLHIIGTMNCGGQETFIMNLFRNIDREKFQFDFVVHSQIMGHYDDEIELLGGKIYRIIPISKNPIKHMIELYRILKSYKYDVFHRHTSSSIVFLDSLIAKLLGINKVIVHAHSNKSCKKRFLSIISRPLLNITTTHKFACSKDAGKWLFGKCNNIKIIPNGIDLDKYKFNKDIRDEYRRELNIENKFVLGHVGRFDEAKNHEFLINIFYEVYHQNKNCVLLLIGTGELEQHIKDKVNKLGLNETVKFLEVRNDVNNLMQAMDLFLFPSIYEGLGIVLVEAQSTGLKCIVSKNIQDEAIVTNNVVKLDLGYIKLWKEEILKSREYDRAVNIKIKKYDINNVTKMIESIYGG